MVTKLSLLFALAIVLGIDLKQSKLSECVIQAGVELASRSEAGSQAGSRILEQLSARGKRSAESGPPELSSKETSELEDAGLQPTEASESGSPGNEYAAEAARAARRPLRIVRLFAPETVQNGTQNITMDCMFKFDKKLDQRLTVKWFFNDELEPIYQWIPELNKRVYSDKYERFLDKSYELAKDTEFMLQAYKWLIATGDNQHRDQVISILSGARPHSPEGPPDGSIGSKLASRPPEEAEEEEELVEEEESRRRRLLANRLNRLAKLGGKHSRQLVESLRAALQMDQQKLEFSRFRALRLIRPTTELNGNFTCSVSSLDGDDIQSTRLVIYEPAKKFAFNISRANNAANQYNLTCEAEGVFPRPSLALFRYRAGPFESHQLSSAAGRQFAQRARMPATSLRQEALAGTQTQLTLSLLQAGNGERPPGEESSEPENALDMEPSGELEPGSRRHSSATLYGISSWALVDESSLSSNVVSQFECLLLLDGVPNYEQRQSLALQRGWHVNSAALTSRSSLLGLFSALASLVCLLIALIVSLLILKHLKRHAKNRVHEKQEDCLRREAPPDNESQSTDSTGHSSNHSPVGEGPPQLRVPRRAASSQPAPDSLAPKSSATQAGLQHQFGLPTNNLSTVAAAGLQFNKNTSDGIYRVPENSTFGGTRFIIGPKSAIPNNNVNYYNASSNDDLSRLAASSSLYHLDGMRGKKRIAPRRKATATINNDNLPPDEHSMDVDEDVSTWPVVRLKTCDGKQFTLTKPEACCSNALRTMIESFQNGPNGSQTLTPALPEFISLKSINSQIFSKISEWCKQHSQDKPNESDTSSTSDYTFGKIPNRDPIKDWDNQFINSMTEEEALRLLHAANYLDITSLLNTLCQTIAKKWEGMNVEDIRRMYNIENDLSREDEHQMLLDNKKIGLDN